MYTPSTTSSIRSALPYQNFYTPKTLRTLSRDEEVTSELAKVFWQQLLESDEPDLSYEDGLLMIGDSGDPYYFRSQPLIQGLILFITEFNCSRMAKIKSIQFNGVHFDYRAWKCLVQGLGNIPQIENLHFIGCGLEAPMIAVAVIDARSLLNRLLGLSIDQNDITPPMAQEIKNLIGRCTSLVAISLSQCGLSDTTFQTVLDGLRGHTSILEIDISTNNLGDISALQVGLALKGMIMLKFLNLRGNDISDTGVKFLSPFLTESPLVELDIGGNKITAVGAKRLLEDCRGLVKLSLAQNENVTSPSFLKATPKAPKLKSMDLSETGITDITIAELAAKKNPIPKLVEGNRVKVILFPDHNVLTLDGMGVLQALFNQTVEVFQQVKKKEPDATPDSPKRDHPALNEPLYKEILASSQATPELLERIKGITNPDREVEQLIREACFEALLDKQFDIVPIEPDGNCLFASLVECIGHKKAVDCFDVNCKDQHMTGVEFRRIVIGHIRLKWELYAPFIADESPNPKEVVENYCNRKMNEKVWAEDVDVQAVLAVMKTMSLKRPIWIYDRLSSNTVVDGKITIPPYMTRGEEDFNEEPILLYRLNDNHYCAMFLKEGEHKRQSVDKTDEAAPIVDSKKRQKPNGPDETLYT